MSTCIADSRHQCPESAARRHGRSARAGCRSRPHGCTLLNSGNVVFASKRPNVAKIASDIEAAIAAKCGFSANVMVVTAQELDRIIDENPLLRLAKEPSKHLVAFVGHAKYLEPLRPLLKEQWKPDALAITQRAAYLWCATGLLDSKMALAFSRKAGATVTTRNWATVLKLQAAAKDAT